MVSMKVRFLSYFFALITVICIISYNFGYSQNDLNKIASSKTENKSYPNQTITDLIVNPNFVVFNETAGLPSNWDDHANSCKATFSCTIKFTDGWNDFVSFAISTVTNSNNTWSSIQSQAMNVNPGEKFQLVNHMKLNQWATQSHVVLEGYNETSKQWYGLTHCPSGINGPMEWREFSCNITIPDSTTKIREVLKAGWSSKPNREATTWFDSIDILGNTKATKS